VLVPTGPGLPGQIARLVLRLLVGVAFIRHGWPKLRNLKTWSTAI
jgi:putative oxidoreductase